MCLNVLLIRDKLLNRGLGSCLATTVTPFMTRSWSSNRGFLLLFCCSITWFCREKEREDRTGNSLWQSVLRIKIYGSKIRSTVAAVQILRGLSKTGDEVAENPIAWSKAQKEKCNTETARSGTSDEDLGWREAWGVCTMSAFCLQREESRRISHLRTLSWAKGSPYHIWHHSDPAVSVAFPVASPVFPGLTGVFALVWRSLQNCKDSHDSPCFSAQLCPCLPQFGASNVLSPEQLQVVTTSSPPTAVEISGVCAAVQEQLERGLAESLGLTNSLCMDSLQRGHSPGIHRAPTSPTWMVWKASPEGELSGWYLLLCLCQCLRIKPVVELLRWCLCCFSYEFCTNSCW